MATTKHIHNSHSLDLHPLPYLLQSLTKDGQSELYRSLCKMTENLLIYAALVRTFYRFGEYIGNEADFLSFLADMVYGERPFHVRFNRPDHIPRFAEFDTDDTHACLIACNDVVDEDALEMTGVDYEPFEIGYWMLDSTLTYVGKSLYMTDSSD
jgi:hypothetical protein